MKLNILIFVTVTIILFNSVYGFTPIVINKTKPINETEEIKEIVINVSDEIEGPFEQFNNMPLMDKILVGVMGFLIIIIVLVVIMIIFRVSKKKNV